MRFATSARPTCTERVDKSGPQDFIRDYRHPIPPIETQSAIAAFLDRETCGYALIEKKQRQIELLQETRAALITHAVTKG